MELITRDVKQNIEKAQEIQQVTFDDDYVIKDNKPDVSKNHMSDRNGKDR